MPSYRTLRDFLTKTKTRQVAFAKRIGVSQSAISKIANGRAVPSLPVALEISRAAKIPVESLLSATTSTRTAA